MQQHQELVLPLWSSPRTERDAGVHLLSRLWQILPPITGLYAVQLTGNYNGTYGASCSTLAAMPTNATALVWSHLGASFQPLFRKAGCGNLSAESERRARIISFEPLFVRATAGKCPMPMASLSGLPYIAVPYPSPFRATSDDSIDEHIAMIMQSRRQYLVAYFGNAHGRDVELRMHLNAVCRMAGSRCASSPAGVGFGTLQTVMLDYADSEFCLMPGGDTPTREAMFDALLCGCIPVFFAECAPPCPSDCPRGLLFESSYHPFLPRFERVDWGAGDWAVVMNTTHVLRDEQTLIQDLDRIGKQQRKSRRARISEFLPNLQYAQTGSRLTRHEDAGMLLRQHLGFRDAEAWPERTRRIHIKQPQHPQRNG